MQVNRLFNLLEVCLSNLKKIFMKKTISVLIALIALTQFSFAQVKWEADAMHTNIRFEVKHTGISFVDGEFRDVQGTMESKSAEDFEGATFNYTVAINSIDTRIEARNAHLLTSDFFDVEKYPEMSLKNAKLTKKWDNHYILEGDLTIKDVTKRISFDTVLNGTIVDQDEKTHVGFTATTTIDRTDFNVNYNDKLPSGIDAVGKYIKIIVNTELIEQ